MVSELFTHLKASEWKELQLTEDEWNKWHPFKVQWFDAGPSTLVEGAPGNRIWGGSGYWNVKIFTLEPGLPPPEPPPDEVPGAPGAVDNSIVNILFLAIEDDHTGEVYPSAAAAKAALAAAEAEFNKLSEADKMATADKAYAKVQAKYPRFNLEGWAQAYVGKAPPLPPTPRRIIGKVTDVALGVPILIGTVEFMGRVVMIGSDGNYVIGDPPEYSGPLICKAAGYEDQEKIITSPLEGDLKVDFKMVSVPLPPVEPPIEPPVEVIKFGFYDITTLITPGVLNDLFSFIMGRDPTLEDITAISGAVNFWLPFTNIFAKAIYGVDLTTGEPATWEDVSLFELTAASVQTVLTAYGISTLTKLGSSLTTKMVTKTGAEFSEKGLLQLLHDLSIKVTSGVAPEATKVAASSGLSAVVKGFLAGLALEAKAHPLFTLLSASMLLTQLDVLGWGFGLLPQSIHNKAETQVKALRGDLIRLSDLIDAKDWIGASELVPKIRLQINITKENLKGAPASFWKGFGFETKDLDTIVEALEISLDSYVKQFPLVVVEDIAFPKEFTLENVEVVDGDSIKFPNHPEVNNEIRMIGIDAHEIETAAGKEEAEYLKSLISGKNVQIKVHEYNDPARVIGLYGRLLAGVFYNDEDIALKMLEKFGKDILTATKYQKKYRWIDWDEYKAVTERKGKVKIYSSPAYSKIYIDGVDTLKITIEEFELDEGTYVIGVAKEGYKAKSETVTIVPDQAIELRFELEESSLVEPEIPGVEFKIYITSTPGNAKLYIDNQYTGHWTPSDEGELSDVIHLFTPGSHEIKVTKAGMEAKKTVTLVEGDNGVINLVLETVGLPPEVPPEEEPPITPPIEEFKIYFTSTPSNAKLWIDDIYTHHWTPSDEKELSDVLHLLTVGTHKITVTKAGMKGEKTITIFNRDMGVIHIDLETIGLPPPEEPPPVEIPPTLEARLTTIETNITLIKEKLGL